MMENAYVFVPLDSLPIAWRTELDLCIKKWIIINKIGIKLKIWF